MAASAATVFLHGLEGHPHGFALVFVAEQPAARPAKMLQGADEAGIFAQGFVLAVRIPQEFLQDGAVAAQGEIAAAGRD